jgi:hypothetical protein
VPHLPPDLAFATALKPFLGNRCESLPVFDYANLGTLRFINWDNQIVGGSDLLEAQRIAHLGKLILDGCNPVLRSEFRAFSGHA